MSWIESMHTASFFVMSVLVGIISGCLRYPWPLRMCRLTGISIS